MKKKVYMIRNNETGKHEEVYNRAYTYETEFSSPDHARSSNVHDIYQDKEKYTIEEYEVEYKLVGEI